MSRRILTQAELWAEAREKFGEDSKAWAFRCPSCGDVATAQDFTAAGVGASLVGQECIGRSLGALGKPGGRDRSGRGCDWAAYGLFRGPWEVLMPNEDDGSTRSIWSFPLADAPSTEAALPARVRSVEVVELPSTVESSPAGDAPGAVTGVGEVGDRVVPLPSATARSTATCTAVEGADRLPADGRGPFRLSSAPAATGPEEKAGPVAVTPIDVEAYIEAGIEFAEQRAERRETDDPDDHECDCQNGSHPCGARDEWGESYDEACDHCPFCCSCVPCEYSERA